MQKLVYIPSCPHFKILSIGELQTLLKDQRNSFKKKSPQPVCVLLFQIRLIINAMIYQNVVKKSAKFKILSFFATKLDISQRIPIYNSVVAWILNFRTVLPAKNRQFYKSNFWTKVKSQCFRQLCKIKNSVFLWDAVTALKQWARKKKRKMKVQQELKFSEIKRKAEVQSNTRKRKFVTCHIYSKFEVFLQSCLPSLGLELFVFL